MCSMVSAIVIQFPLAGKLRMKYVSQDPSCCKVFLPQSFI
jgi:hypothetical protein